jgi:hypothetical protein
VTAKNAENFCNPLRRWIRYWRRRTVKITIEVSCLRQVLGIRVNPPLARWQLLFPVPVIDCKHFRGREQKLANKLSTTDATIRANKPDLSRSERAFPILWILWSDGRPRRPRTVTRTFVERKSIAQEQSRNCRLLCALFGKCVEKEPKPSQGRVRTPDLPGKIDISAPRVRAH